MQQELHIDTNRKIKFSDAYSLRRFSELSQMQQEKLSSFAADQDNYGVLLPRDASSGTIKIICKTTAAFLLQCKSLTLLSNVSDTFNIQEIEKLILDGIIEQEIQKDDQAAFPSAPYPDFNDRDISHRAIFNALACNPKDRKSLSAVLYCYNRKPWSGNNHSIQDLTNKIRMEHQMGMGDKFISSNDSSTGNSWYFWKSSEIKPTGEGNYKLYINVIPQSIPQAVNIVRIFQGRINPFAVKFARSELAVQRPDKFVMYFRDFESLRTSAETLREPLGKYQIQDLPFTASICMSRILTWGYDLPHDLKMPAWIESRSWRSNICDVAAVAIAMAVKTHTDKQLRWQYIMNRLSLEGIDVFTWVPICPNNKSALIANSPDPIS